MIGRSGWSSRRDGSPTVNVATGLTDAAADEVAAALDEGSRRLIEHVSTLARTAEEEANRRAFQRFFANWWVLLALGAVTMWTGLTALYFDKAFGTLRDYVTILVWGFGRTGWA